MFVKCGVNEEGCRVLCHLPPPIESLALTTTTVIFGGADPKIVGLVPSDIEIRDNDFDKPLSWKAIHKWSVKNLFELKSARRVLVDGNRFQNSWVDSQHGYAIMLTPRNQNGKAPWSAVEDLTFTRNLVTQCSSGIEHVHHVCLHEICF